MSTLIFNGTKSPNASNCISVAMSRSFGGEKTPSWYASRYLGLICFRSSSVIIKILITSLPIEIQLWLNNVMQIVYHPDGSMSNLSTPDLKNIAIDYQNWYCPIHEYVWMIRWDGTIKSGTCGQNNLFHMNKPFWGRNGGVQTNSFCKFIKGSCNCGSDLNSPKAINKEVYDKFVSEADKVSQSNLPL